jgi:Transglycosylase SLT domain
MLPKRVLIGSGVIAASVLFGSAGVKAAAPFALDPWRLCSQAIAVEERTQAIPKHLLSAIALAESGRKHPMLGKRMPWPWSVMAEGQGRYLPTKAAAINEVRQLQARGISNIDVGCMQVNLYHHADAFLSLEQAFDPASNVAYAGQFLRSLFADSGSWQEAAGRYHSATPEHKIPYREKVVQLWNQQQQLDFAGSNAFGSGALTAGLESGGITAGSRVRSPALLLSLADRRIGTTVRLPTGRAAANTMRTYYASAGGNRSTSDIGRAARTLDEEAAFARRRAQYLQELRQAIAEVKRLSAVEVARDYSRKTAALR